MVFPRSLISLDPFEFRRFLSPLTTSGGEALTMPMDVREQGDAYLVHAEIPGVKKEDIQVNIDGNQISIAAEIKPIVEEKDNERVLRTERFYGKLSRTFQLGAEIDEAKSEAKFTDGILELRLVKKAAAAAKLLAVS